MSLIKRKKGFTLVELMIVVVIMAVLVAVAVPVYQTVTTNAQKRICLANQREIVAQISNAATMNGWTSKTFTIRIVTSSAGTAASNSINYSSVSAGAPAIASIRNMFATVPYCPVSSSWIIAAVVIDASGKLAVTMSCRQGASHKLQ